MENLVNALTLSLPDLELLTKQEKKTENANEKYRNFKLNNN